MFEYAWEAINDAAIQARFKAIAPEAPPGSPEAQAAWEEATEGLDFDSSDGSPADEYAGKSLDLGGGGRSELLRNRTVARDGETPEAAASIARSHFYNIVAKAIPDTGQGFGARIEAWRAKNPGPVAG